MTPRRVDPAAVAVWAAIFVVGVLFLVLITGIIGRDHRVDPVRQCTHARKGIVSNQQFTNDRARPLCSITTCDRPACIEAAVFQVQGFTGEKATYLSDVDRRAAKAAALAGDSR